MTKHDKRQAARDVVARALRYTTGKAQDEVTELREAELDALLELPVPAGHRDEPALVKDILSSAYDRRQKHADVGDTRVNEVLAPRDEPAPPVIAAEAVAEEAETGEPEAAA